MHRFSELFRMGRWFRTWPVLFWGALSTNPKVEAYDLWWLRIGANPCYLLKSKLLPPKTDRGNGVMVQNTDGISFKKKISCSCWWRIVAVLHSHSVSQHIRGDGHPCLWPRRATMGEPQVASHFHHGACLKIVLWLVWGTNMGRCPRTSENRTMDRLLNRPCFVEAKVWRTHRTTITLHTEGGREGRQRQLGRNVGKHSEP